MQYYTFFALLAFTIVFHQSRSESTTIQVCCPDRNLTYSEEWNYVNVHPNAYLFWWLYREETTKLEDSKNRPLFIWLQGGPGSSGVGFGNFEELGPLDAQLKARRATWLSRGDLIFVDNPVGTGYSYVTNDEAYTRDVDEIARDLTNFTIDFMSKHKEYQSRPYYIVCESYGGKMAAVYAWHLYQAIGAGLVKMNFRGVGLGDSWISPIDFVTTWPDYLYYFSRLSSHGLQKATLKANDCKSMVEKQMWSEATNCWDDMEGVIGDVSDGVSWYNVMKQGNEDPWSLMLSRFRSTTPIERLYNKHVRFQQNDDLSTLMNGVIKKKLKIIPDHVSWGGQSGYVFAYQSADFMKPVIDTVDNLLAKTNLTVFVYNGQYDLICDTVGVETWMNSLKWPSLPDYQRAKRSLFNDKFAEKELAGYVQQYENLYFFWLFKAGHMVPADAPTASLTMLDIILAR